MANEIIVNAQIAGILKNHGVNVNVDNEFVNTNLADDLKFKTRLVYHEINRGISSRLDVMAVTDTGERIIERFGDFGATVDEAINKTLILKHWPNDGWFEGMDWDYRALLSQPPLEAGITTILPVRIPH